jgi:hypothetical protein
MRRSQSFGRVPLFRRNKNVEVKKGTASEALRNKTIWQLLKEGEAN